MPDVEAFKRRISSMIEEAIIKEDEAVSIMSRKEKNLISEENIEKLLAMRRKNIAAEILKKLLENKIKYFRLRSL